MLRLWRGESLDAVSRELKVTAARLSEWRDADLAGDEARSRAAGLTANTTIVQCIT